MLNNMAKWDIMDENKCSKCNSSFPRGSLFCPSCGTKVEAEGKICQNCGSKMALSDQVCGQCEIGRAHV